MRQCFWWWQWFNFIFLSWGCVIFFYFYLRDHIWSEWYWESHSCPQGRAPQAQICGLPTEERAKKEAKRASESSGSESTETVGGQRPAPSVFIHFCGTLCCSFNINHFSCNFLNTILIFYTITFLLCCMCSCFWLSPPMVPQSYNDFIQKTKAELSKEPDSTPATKPQIKTPTSATEKPWIKPPPLQRSALTFTSPF